MSNEVSPEDWSPPLYVGYHDTKRNAALTQQQLDDALDCNYNMLTTPITNNHFHTRINALLSDHLSQDNVPTISHLTHLDTDLEPYSLTDSVIAFTSPWIDVCSPDPLIAGISRQVLFMEVAFAAFCGFVQVVIQGPRLSHHDSIRGKDVVTNNIMQYARAIQECLNIGLRLQISVLLPFSDNPTNNISVLPTRNDHIDPDLDPSSPTGDDLSTWEAWNTIRTICKYHTRLAAALEMPAHLPSTHVQTRWYAEPVKALFFSITSFSTNPAGWPSLQLSVQSFIKDVMRLKVIPWIVLVDLGTNPGPNEYGETPIADGYLPDEAMASNRSTSVASNGISATSHRIHALAHLNYIRYLERKREPLSQIESQRAGFKDYLQIPLQPLTDNLESLTYEVFEEDPVKYDQYEKAIRKALRDWTDQQKPVSGPHGKVVVVVAGAGRGPLVTRALKASKDENVPIDMWAVEKNPNAFVLLQRRVRGKWKGLVTVEHSDMRTWKGPWQTNYSPTPAEAQRHSSTTPPEVALSKAYYPVDILISELLGSFGDNELSPECLDGIIHLLSKPHGISIPQSYTAWLTPVSAPKLYADISHRSSYDASATETPAVVWFQQIDYLSRETIYKDPPSTSQASSTSQTTRKSSSTAPNPNVLCAWEFSHKAINENDTESSLTHINKGSLGGQNAHNTRFAKLNFRVRYRGVCHGLAGYFESVLYPGVELSTNPNTIDEKSRDMISWFPIFFPLKTPLYVPGTSMLDVSIWRQTDGRKVWYEWMMESSGWNLMRTGLRAGSSRLASTDTATGACIIGAGPGAGDEEKKGKEGKIDRRMVRLGTTELHSSIKNGCLM